MKKGKDWIKRNDTIFVMAVAASICFLLCSLLFMHNTGRQDMQKSIQYLRDVTSQRQAALNQQIEGDLQILHGVAIMLSEIDLGNKDLLLTLLDGVNRSNDFVRMGLAGVNGMVDLVDLDGSVYQDVDLSSMGFFQTALEGKDGISGTLSSPVTKQNVNCYTTPVHQDGNVVAVLCAVNSDEVLWDILNVPVFQGQGAFLVIDGQGIVVSPGAPGSTIQNDTDITQILSFSSPEKEILLKALAAGEAGSYTAYMAGECMFVTSHPLEYNAWHVLSIVPRVGITAYYIRTAMGIMWIILAAFLLFILLLLWQKYAANRNKESLERLAYTDLLTGARNQTKFLLDADCLLARRGDKKYVVWSFDFKKFTNINDLFGSAVGDEMLQRVASIFEQLATDDSAFCRISADLFVGLYPYQEEQVPHDWMRRLQDCLARQEIIPDSKMHIDIAMGFYFMDDFPEKQLDISAMMNWASMARKKAKEMIGSGVALFTEEMSERVRWETELEASGRAALSNGEITFFLQPKVNILNDCVVTGAEVLARWKHPAHGWISPSEFIPLFERNGTIVELDRYIFDRACQWYAQERDQRDPTFRLSVNVSRHGLLRADFLEYYTNVKQRYDVADGVLELEFTESAVLDDYDLFQNVVTRLRKSGFLCSIDDFGSGYSSLNVLKNLTIDELKLDSAFQQGGINTEREQTIVSCLIRMARLLGIQTVAEGVETEKQVLFLQRAGCDIVQGYYFSKPLSPADFKKLMTKTNGRLLPPNA